MPFKLQAVQIICNGHDGVRLGHDGVYSPGARWRSPGARWRYIRLGHEHEARLVLPQGGVPCPRLFGATKMMLCAGVQSTDAAEQLLGISMPSLSLGDGVAAATHELVELRDHRAQLADVAREV